MQLREKHATSREFYDAAQAVMSFAHDNDVKIIINDRVDIVLALKAHGVHLGQDDLAPEHARRLLGREAVIGFSTHSIDQACAAVSMPIDYVAYGPIFTTTTKENPDAVVGTEGLRRIRDSIGNFPLVAIGGIGEKHLRSVIDAGADSAAIISEILSNPTDISGRYENLNLTTSQLA